MNSFYPLKFYIYRPLFVLQTQNIHFVPILLIIEAQLNKTVFTFSFYLTIHICISAKSC